MLIGIVFVVFSPLFQLLLGRWCWKRLRLWLGDVRIKDVNVLAVWLLGLFAHLLAMLILKCLGLPWVLAALLPLLPGYWYRGEIIFYVRKIYQDLHPNYVLWFAVQLGLGLSLFQANGEIETPWQNNYADLAFHFGMITSFVWGDNFPPQYHIYAGEWLSYPFLINLWTAALWRVYPTFSMLAFIFSFQWVLIWSGVYVALRGNRFWLLPWAVLLGGGSWALLDQITWPTGCSLPLSLDSLSTGLGTWVQSWPYSWLAISKGHPWAVFLTTIWVTQRSSLLGLLQLVVVFRIFYKAENTVDASKARSCMFLAGLLMAPGGLVHVHFALVACMLLGGLLALQLVHELVSGRGKTALQNLLAFSLGVSPALLLIPWLGAKSQILAISHGWLVNEANLVGWARFLASLGMWWNNAPHWLLISGVALILLRRWREFLLLVAVFLFGSIIRLAYWDWDQIKFYVAIYVAIFAIWSSTDRRAALWLQPLLVILMLPALLETLKVFSEGPNFTVYDQKALSVAAELRQVLPVDAVVAAAPDHNSPVTLTGRKLLYGYEGTLWSHGLEYGSRQEMMESLDLLADCMQSQEFKEPAGKLYYPAFICPDYLLWSARERQYWHRDVPGSRWAATKLSELYRRRTDVKP